MDSKNSLDLLYLSYILFLYYFYYLFSYKIYLGSLYLEICHICKYMCIVCVHAHFHSYIQLGGYKMVRISLSQLKSVGNGCRPGSKGPHIRYNGLFMAYNLST